jgi:hypothetical protein
MLPAVEHQVEERLGQTRPAWELADIFREYGEAYRGSHRLPPTHLKVFGLGRGRNGGRPPPPASRLAGRALLITP